MSKEKNTESKYVWKNLLAGGTAGAVECIINYPTEYVKTQLQLDAKAAKGGGERAFNGVFDCAKKVIAKDGVQGLYRGLSTLVVGSIPKAAIRFAAFQQFSAMLAGKDGKLSDMGSLAAGLGAGFAEAAFAVTPMETVKTKLIADQNRPIAEQKYKGMVHGVRTMIAEEGFAGVYRGLTATMLKQGGNQAVRFTVFGKVKLAFAGGDKDKVKTMSGLATFGAGATAGGISVYATMPFDVVKTQMQSPDRKLYSGNIDCLKKIVQAEGPLALWKGTTPRLGRVCVSSAIIFSSYEFVMKNMILPVFPDE